MYLAPALDGYTLKKHMKLASAVEGGLTGATTLTLLQEALHKIDGKAPRPLLHKSGLMKQLRKNGTKPGDNNKLYIKLAGELLSNAAYFGLSSIGKKKNAVLRGGLLGAAAGLGSAFFTEDKEQDTTDDATAVDSNTSRNSIKKKVLTVTLYTAGGLLAGFAIKKINQKSGKKLRKKLKALKLK